MKSRFPFILIVLIVLGLIAIIYSGRASAQSGTGPPTFTLVGAHTVPEIVLTEDYGQSRTPRVSLLYQAAPAGSIIDDVEVETNIGPMTTSYLWVENIDDEACANPPPWGGSGVWWAFGFDRVLWITESPWRGMRPPPGNVAGRVFLADGHYAQFSSSTPLPAFDGTLDYWGASGRRMGAYSATSSYVTHFAGPWEPEFAPDGSPLTVKVSGQDYPAHQLWFSPRATAYARGFNYGGHGNYTVASMYAHIIAPSVTVKVTVRGHFPNP